MMVFSYIVFPFLLLLLLEFILRALVKSRYGRKLQEFPNSCRQELERFKNYDSVLGWELRPGGERYDTSHAKSSSGKARAKYAINENGARYQPKPTKPLKGEVIEFFGDSTCFCRDVNDHETFPFYLEEIHGIGPCVNYGVGNYGVDQALLRAEKRMKGGGVACLFMPMASLYRVGCVYKHYAELGNNWAIKPRFIMCENNLKIVNRPFVGREELLHLKDFAQHFRSYDFYYSEFKKIAPKGKVSYLWHFIFNNNASTVLMRQISDSGHSKILSSLALTGTKILKYCGKQSYQPHKLADNLLKTSLSEHGELFASISERFISLAQKRGSRGFIFISPQGWTYKNPDVYHQATRNLRFYCNKKSITLFDFGDELFNISAKQVKEFGAEKIHLTPAGNRFLADWLAKIINNI